MDAKKREIRTLDCQLRVREAAPDAQGESRTIEGTAIVFNAESEVLDDWGYRFREVILPSAATMEFLNSQDIKMNMLHERELTIARANKGQGTLKLSVDERGVNFEFDAPRCDIGDRCLEMVRRGDYSGCSFEFWPDEYDEEVTHEDGEAEGKITHRKFKAITALTIGMDPAYRQTTVNARELTERACGDGDDEQRACGTGDDDQRGCGGGEKPEERQDCEDTKSEGDKPDEMTDEERAAAEQVAKQAEAEKAAAELAEREQKEREAVAIARARRHIINLYGRPTDDYDMDF